MTQALTYAYLRETYLKLDSDSECAAGLLGVMKLCWPSYVPNPLDGGDCGDLLWPDGSRLHWDWDDGYLECEGVRLSYPWGTDDPMLRAASLSK